MERRNPHWRPQVVGSNARRRKIRRKRIKRRYIIDNAIVTRLRMREILYEEEQ